jgi:error-prone DNA polymerase
LRSVAGLGESGWTCIGDARSSALFENLRDFCRRTRLFQDVVTNLIRAGAMDAFGERRELLWELGEIDCRPGVFDLPLSSVAADLPKLDPLEQTIWEYELLGLSPASHIMVHYREVLRRAGILSTWQVKKTDPGRRVRVAGMMAVRQRPATAKGILFISLEDESGLLDLVVKQDEYARLREVLRGQPLIAAEGIVQRSGRATSLLMSDACSLL